MPSAKPTIMPSSTPSTKPASTCIAVIAVWKTSRSRMSMCRNSFHTFDADGMMKAGMCSRPGSHCHAARNSTSTSRLPITMPRVEPEARAVLIACPAAAPSGSSLHELVGVEVLHRRLLLDDALLQIEILQRRETALVHLAQHLLALIDVLHVHLEDLRHRRFLAGMLGHGLDVVRGGGRRIVHDRLHALQGGADQLVDQLGVLPDR